MIEAPLPLPLTSFHLARGFAESSFTYLVPRFPFRLLCHQANGYCIFSPVPCIVLIWEIGRLQVNLLNMVPLLMFEYW